MGYRGGLSTFKSQNPSILKKNFSAMGWVVRPPQTSQWATPLAKMGVVWATEWFGHLQELKPINFNLILFILPWGGWFHHPRLAKGLTTPLAKMGVPWWPWATPFLFLYFFIFFKRKRKKLFF
jgi:hypothetical protein